MRHTFPGSKDRIRTCDIMIISHVCYLLHHFRIWSFSLVT